MNILQVKGIWNIARGKLLQHIGLMLHDDRRFFKGKEDELIGRIQKRTGETREAVEKALKQSCPTCCCS